MARKALCKCVKAYMLQKEEKRALPISSRSCLDKKELHMWHQRGNPRRKGNIQCVASCQWVKAGQKQTTGEVIWHFNSWSSSLCHSLTLSRHWQSFICWNSDLKLVSCLMDWICYTSQNKAKLKIKKYMKFPDLWFSLYLSLIFVMTHNWKIQDLENRCQLRQTMNIILY